MPNQRKKSKVHLGGYYEKDLVAELRREAKLKGVSTSKLIEDILTEQVAAYKREKLDRANASK